MRQRLFSMLGYGRMLTRAGRVATALLAVAMLTLSAQTAKAETLKHLYAKVADGGSPTTMTLVCDNAAPSEAGFTFTEFNGTGGWNSSFRGTITSVTVDASCSNYDGTTLANLFYYCDKLTTITNLDKLKTDNVTDMASLFHHCEALTSSIDLSAWNTSNVANMKDMFATCKVLTTINFGDGTKFKTDNVTNMLGMFEECRALTALDLSHFNTAKVENMSGMFYDCRALTTLNVSSFNTEKVTNMYQMFACCYALTTITGLNNFNTAKVTTMQDMFRGSDDLASLDLSTFNTAKVENMNNMFKGCSLLATITVGDGWSTAAVTSHTDMFDGCSKLEGRCGTAYNTSYKDKTYAHLDYGEVDHGYLTANGLYAKMSGKDMTVSYGIDKTAVAYYKEGTGFGATCKTATSVTLDATCADFAGTSLEYLFDGFTAATSITGLNNLNTANVTNMIGTFRDCQVVTLLDLSAWDTRNVTTSNNMTLMFKRCYELKTIIVGANWIKPYSSDMFTNSKKIVGGYGATTATSVASTIDSDNADTSETGYLTGLTRTLTAGGPDGEGKYWATFFNSAVGYTISGGEAFAGVYNSTTKKVELTSLGTDIPANTPVVICATSGTVDMTLDNTIAAYAGTNNLVGIDVKTATPDNSYCLAISAGVAGFYKYTSTDGANIPARRAYLTIAASAPNFIGFGDETTGINALNGEGFTVNGSVYNLAGQRVAQPQKGLYIVNGKKVVIK